MPWIEFRESYGVNIDAQGRGSAVRVFKAWDVSRIQIATNPGSVLALASPYEGLPGYLSPLPEHTTLRLDNYDIQAEGSIHVVRALYSHDGRFQFPAKIDPLAPGFNSPVFAYQNEEVEIPIFAPGQTIVTHPNGTETVVPRWIPQTRRVRHNFEKFIVRVSLASWSGAVKDAISEQNDTLHLLSSANHPIFGVTPLYYLFRLADSVQLDPDRGFIIEYCWTRDPGTKVFVDENGSVPPGYPDRSFLWEGTGYIRPPFHDLIPVASTIPGAPPGYRVSRPYRIDALGWRNLPGLRT